MGRQFGLNSRASESLQPLARHGNTCPPAKLAAASKRGASYSDELAWDTRELAVVSFILTFVTGICLFFGGTYLLLVLQF